MKTADPNTDTLLEQLVNSPKLVLYFQEIQNLLESERIKREQFYQILAEHDRAEFINGEIKIRSYISEREENAMMLLLSLLETFVTKHRLGVLGSETTLISLTRNDYQPDICFFDRSKAIHFTAEQAQFPAPDFIVEILSPGAEEIDRTIKFIDYAAHGVREYWIVDSLEEAIEQYILRDGRYQLLVRSNSGQIKSLVMTDFMIPIRAIFDSAENLNTLHHITIAL